MDASRLRELRIWNAIQPQWRVAVQRAQRPAIASEHQPQIGKGAREKFFVAQRWYAEHHGAQ